MTPEHAFAWVERQVGAGALQNAVLGVADRDGVVDVRAFGRVLDRATRTDDVYPLFSVTKPIVALAALRLVERGTLSLLDPLASALPEFGAGRDDTVRLGHLLTHTSGIEEPPLAPTVPLREALLTAGQDFAAGSMTRYSSIAFEGVAALVEHASGRPLIEHLGDLARDTGAQFTFEPGEIGVPAAAAHGLDHDRLRALAHPGAGLHGTVAALLRLGTDLLSNAPRAVGPATLRAALTPRTSGLPKLHPYPAERGQEWGLGWNLLHSAPGLLDTDVYGHAGWAGTQFWILPGAGVCFALLSNQPGWGSDIAALHNAVRFGADAASPR